MITSQSVLYQKSNPLPPLPRYEHTREKEVQFGMHRIHNMHFNLEYLKAFGGFVVGSATWLTGYLAQTADAMPQWFRAVDTPMVVAGMGYGIFHLWRELAKERKARIDDRDNFDAKLRNDSEKLLTATNTQTNVLRDLIRELRANGLHKSKPGEED